jgi:hypothetical protein
MATDEPTGGARRRYRALIARAEDQAGTPEGDVCNAMAAKMLAADPSLADEGGAELPVEWREYKATEPFERDLLVHIGKYVGASANEYKNKRAKARRDAILFETDAPTHAAIEHTFEVLRVRMRKVLLFALGGFFNGAVPSGATQPSDDFDDDDDELHELASAARNFGRTSSPRKALPMRREETPG